MILLWLGTFLWGLSNMILRPKRLSSGMVYKMAVRDGKLNEERYKKLKRNSLWFFPTTVINYPVNYLYLLIGIIKISPFYAMGFLSANTSL